nr:nardilysin-like isoform X1 [Ipomoea batatas]
MLVYPPEDVVYGDYAYEIWDEQLIKYILGFFRADNMRVDVVTKSLNNSSVTSQFASFFTGL